ncbi:hypothetical protein [Akkermansia muciniphila]|uniref:hypothetical protein n=1 Tax=Akkermansia muciniphila TaxID=239935 RepID=UPI000FE1502F|nr:hypothetical protein [Akkermansia muciniphila]QAA37096.1 hypothetical protein C1I88_09435 [Akkermansia muciniphila]
MNNNVKERPILFSADMIRALLQEYSMPGQYKNQTRRTRGLNRFNNFPEHLKERGWEIQEFFEVDPGLWVAISKDDEGDFPDDFNPWVRCPYGKAGDRLWVKENVQMPRKAARILLEITEVRIERLLDITPQDAQMEGIESVWHDEMTDAHLWKDYSGRSNGYIFALMSYFSLWDKLKGAGSSKMNPWVWVIKFKVLTINGELK